MIKVIFGAMGSGKTDYLFSEIRHMENKKVLFISKPQMVEEFVEKFDNAKNVEFAEAKDYNEICMILFSLHDKFDAFAVDNYYFTKKEIILISEISNFIQKTIHLTTDFNKNEKFLGIYDKNVTNIVFYEKFVPTLID